MNAGDRVMLSCRSMHAVSLAAHPASLVVRCLVAELESVCVDRFRRKNEEIARRGRICRKRLHGELLQSGICLRDARIAAQARLQPAVEARIRQMLRSKGEAHSIHKNSLVGERPLIWQSSSHASQSARNWQLSAESGVVYESH